MANTNNTAIVCGDGYTTMSGLRYVATNLARMLQEMGMKVVYLSLTNQPHDPVDNAIFIGNCTGEFDEQIVKYKPTLVVTNHDPWLLLAVMQSQYRHTFTWVGYQSAEADYYPNECVTNLPEELFRHPDGRKERRPGQVGMIPIGEVVRNMDYVIAYNQFGAKAIEGMGAKVRKCIHNGVDPKRTYKIDNRELVLDRRHAIGVKDDEILFMHASRNSVRKRQDVLLESWFRFLELGKEKLGHRPKAKLYLHSEQFSMNGLAIPSIINRLKLNDTVIMPQALNFSDQDLNLFYNACDVYVSLPGAEGHGLPVSETMNCGKPIIYGSYGGHTTFCDGCGISVPPVQFLSSPNIDMPSAIISSKKAAEAMLTLYLDREMREQYGQAGLEKAKALHWEVLDPQFVECFQEAQAEARHPFVFAKKVV